MFGTTIAQQDRINESGLRRRYFGWNGMSPKVDSGSIFLLDSR